MVRLFVAFGPLVLGPLSEIYGRSRVLQLSNLWYLGETRRNDILLNDHSIPDFDISLQLGT